jgi:hypothetical protein
MSHQLTVSRSQCQWTRIFVFLTTLMATKTQLGLKRHQESHYWPHHSRKLWFQHYYQWLFLHIAMLAKKCLESLPISETNDRNGSGGGTNFGNFTFPPAQHNSVDSPLYFNALQYWTFPQLLLMCRQNNLFSDRSGMLLFPGSHYHHACGIVEIHFVLIAVVVFDVHELVQFCIFNHSRTWFWHANMTTTFYVSCGSTMRLAHDIARHTFDCLWQTKSGYLLLGIVSPLSTNY